MASSPLLAWVRSSLGPCYFHLKYSTNLPSAVSTSYQLFLTPVHLKTADGFFFLKFGSAHATLLFPSCLRINCKCFTLAFRALHDLLSPNSATVCKPKTATMWRLMLFPRDSPWFPLCLAPDDTSSFNAFSLPPPLSPVLYVQIICIFQVPSQMPLLPQSLP